MKIPFNKPYLAGNELKYIREAVKSGKISGNGQFTKKCHTFFESKYGFKKCLLTTSCTDALEMCAILADIKPGDEVILPSYTFVSTANAFVLRGAKLVFADSMPTHPNLDPGQLPSLITKKTKAIVVVHYAGVACPMDEILNLAEENDLIVIEDAAQGIDSFYRDVPLGRLGHLSAFSFHETKNIISGEGGMIAINDERFIPRSEIIWEKGTNRAAFFRGETDKYSWVDIGSSFLPSEISAAYLWGQLDEIESIQAKRLSLWNQYFDALKTLNEIGVGIPYIPNYASNNAHIFYLICRSPEERISLIDHLNKRGIHAIFHYLSLHTSPYFCAQHDGRNLSNCNRYADCLIRLPLYFELKTDQVEFICETILQHTTYK